MNPALGLLLTVGFIQFWVMPAVAWALLKGQRDTAAKFWFAGTTCYAVTASLFVFHAVLPNLLSVAIGFVLVTLMLAFLCESLRREFQTGPTPWKWIALLVVFNLVLIAIAYELGGDDVMRCVQLIIISLLDIVCAALLVHVIRLHKSGALMFVLGGVVVVALVNLLRVYKYIETGESPTLLNFSFTSNLGFVVNYLSVVLYSFGYWGFVIEKNRATLVKEVGERARAQAGETEAIDRERLTKELLHQREELISQLARMQRAAQAGALSASIAHEINQPLASLRLNVEEAIELRRTDGDTARLDVLLSRIADENQRATAIIRTLREIFRGEQSAPELRKVDEVVGAMITLLQPRAQELGVEVRTDLAAPFRVRIGAGELEHVVLNLISNALDILSTDVTETPWVAITTSVSDGQVYLSVRDSGPGVSDELRELLFDLFSGSQRGGLGLGLWLSRHIVERNGGTIVLEPAWTGAGACFSVRLVLQESTPLN